MRPAHPALARLAVTPLVALPLAFAAPLAAAADGLQTYKDWTIGCDNTRRCTAIGRGTEESVPGAYVVVKRDAGPAAVPAVEVVLPMDGPPAGVALTIAADDPKAGVLPQGKSSVDENGYVRTRFAGEAAGAFVAAVRNASRLQVTPRPGGADAGSAVSLSGMSAALLKMDDVQGRVGTVTALVKSGPKPAASVPAAPATPVVAAVKLAELSGSGPKSLPRQPAADTGCPEDGLAIGFALGGSTALWGTCTSAGAYNFFYDFYVFDGAKQRPAVFPQPPGTGKAGGGLTNPWLSDDGRTIGAFEKGRGLGDCGVLGSWAFDGKALQVVGYSVMGDCVGVSPDDWPALWRANLR